MKDLVLGIDVGTGGCKVALIDEAGDYISDGYAEYKTYHPYVGWSEQKAADWFPAFLSALACALEKQNLSAAQVAGLSLSASAHNAVLLDSENRVIRDTIMWMDQRSFQESEYLKEHHGNEIFRLGYASPSPTWTLPQLMWIRINEPEVFSKIARIMFVKDYLRYQLTGTWTTDYIEAQGSLLFDNLAWGWSERLCAIGDVPISVLPPLAGPGDIIGRITAEASCITGLRQGVPVINGASDTALEHYGVGAIAAGDCVVKIATASTVNIFRNRPYPHPAALTYAQVPEGLWDTCLSTSSAAASLRWYRDTFFCNGESENPPDERSIYGVLDEEASSISPGCDGLFFHPYLSGERSPYWDPKLRGSFVGFTAHHVRGHFNRAILEGVAFSIRNNFDIANDMQPIPKIKLVGGGAKSALWSQIVANVVNRPIIKYKNDDSSFGAAMLAAVGIGMFSSHKEAVEKCVRVVSQILPDEETVAAYQTAYLYYNEIYKDLRGTYQKL